MKPIPIHEAKTHLSRYISEAKQGKKIYIGGFGRPEVVLMKTPQQSKVWGLLKGKTGYSEPAWKRASQQVGKDFARSFKP